jgi:hypothetical protein
MSLPDIRFAAMSHVFLHKRVTPSGMVPNDVVMVAFVAQLDNPALQHSGKRALEGGKECERSMKRRRRAAGGVITWENVVGMRAEGLKLARENQR